MDLIVDRALLSGSGDLAIASVGTRPR